MAPPSALNYYHIKQNIAKIAASCKRDPDRIKIVAVSKYHPWPDMEPVYDSGCRDFGESRVHEAILKMDNAPKDIRWHLIGHLQKNKVHKAVGRFVLIHSVDSFELANKINECGEEDEDITSILLQINISGESTKQGMTPDACRRTLDAFLDLEFVKLEGLMTMAPLDADESTIRSCFSGLRDLRDQLVRDSGDDELFQELSMGMSQDYPIAIREGATILRIGSAIFGSRL